MVLIVYLFIIFINLFMAYCKKNSKIVVSCSIIGWMLLMCGYRRPFWSDLDNYNLMYLGEQENTIGMKIIFYVGSKLNISFYTFHYILLFIFLLISVIFIVKLCENWHLSLALFGIYYIIITADQIKNHTAFIFLSIALLSLYKDKKVLTVVLLAIATAIHYSFILYLLIFLFTMPKSNKIKKIVLIFSGFVTLCCILKIDTIGLKYCIIILKSVARNFKATFLISKIEMYLKTRTNLGYILCFIFQMINYIMLKYSEKLSYKNEDSKLTKYALNVNEIGFMMFPLFIYNMQWYRIIRELLLLNYCVYGSTYYHLRRNTVRRAGYLLLILLSVIIWLFGDLCLKSKATSVLIPFFSNNMILG